MKTVIITLFCLIPFCGSAETWEDPYFEHAILEAGIICMGIVEKSSPSETSIQITKIYKGDQKTGSSTTILRSPIVGHGHEDDVLNVGDTFFFMAKSHEDQFQAFSDTFWNFPVDDSSIVFPIRDPLLYLPLKLEHFEQLLGFLLKKPKQKKVDKFVTARFEELIATGPLTKSREEVQIQLFNLEILYHLGKSEHAGEIVKFLESPYFHVRWSCIRALGKCGGSDAEAAILKHLDNEDVPKVQSAMGKAIFDLNIRAAKATLENQIPEVSSQECMLAGDIMNPVMNALPAPRYSYGAALMKIEGREGSYDELLKSSHQFIASNPNIELDILENKKTFYSIETAMENPDSVFILVLGRGDYTAVPPEVENFKNLKSLKLYRNDIKELPAYLANFDLIELEISDNKLEEIPPVIFNCKGLKKLDLESNKLTEIDPRLFELTELRELNFGSNSIASIPEGMKRLVNLRSLNLRINDLEAIPSDIGQLTKLEFVQLYANDFRTFPEALLASESIKSIGLGSNSIKGLPIQVTEMKKLKSIDLSLNPLSLKARQEIANFPPGVIIDTKVYSGRFYSIQEAMENRTEATTIHDSNNDYGNFQLDLSVLTATRYLVLNENKFTKFPAGLTTLVNLKSLGLRGNSIAEVPAEIHQMKGLTRLDLSNNELNTLPESLGNLKLEHLILSGNNFSEQEKERIASWFDEGCKIVW